MVKETLTYDIARRDALEHLSWTQSRRADTIFIDNMFFPLAVISACLWIMFGPVIGIPVAVVACVFLIKFVRSMLTHKKQNNGIEQADFHIGREKLISISEEVIYEPRIVRGFGDSSRRNYKEVTVFNFSVGSWRLRPMDYFYTWSKELKMTGNGIANTSLEGEEFLVVTLKGSGDICAIYNTKFFKYVE